MTALFMIVRRRQYPFETISVPNKRSHPVIIGRRMRSQPLNYPASPGKRIKTPFGLGSLCTVNHQTDRITAARHLVRIRAVSARYNAVSDNGFRVHDFSGELCAPVSYVYRESIFISPPKIEM
jgi:hypothetical protein